MKTDDIFEALTDIDDKFIERAHPILPDPLAPVEVFPAERTKPRRGTLIAAAACAACVTAWGAVGVNYLHEKGFFTFSPAATSAPAASNTSISASVDYCFWYPGYAKYIVSEDITNSVTNFSYPTNGAHFERWDDESYYAKDYDQLAAKSDLIVAGQFVELPHQTQDPGEAHLSAHTGVTVRADGTISDDTEASTDASMFNYLQVERVLKGNVKAGDMLLINQETSINLGGDDHYCVFAYDRLTPMLKGDKWIYFLQKTKDGYIPVNGAQGRYPLPNNKNFDLTMRGIDEFSAYPNAAPARAEIYDRLKILLSDSAQNIQQLDVPNDDSRAEFSVDEFPQYAFMVTNTGVLFRKSGELSNYNIQPLINEWGLENLYLADLNSDGKREICATIRIGDSGITAVMVCDLENGVNYSLRSDNAEDVYTLAEEGGRIMAVTNEYLPLYVSRYPEERSRVPLTLDMMKKLDPELEEISTYGVVIDGPPAAFLMPEYPGVWFTASEEEIVMHRSEEPIEPAELSETLISASRIQNVFLYDVNGDGKREICTQVYVDGKIGIRVYDVSENASYSLFGAENTSYKLSVNDGKIIHNVSGKETLIVQYGKFVYLNISMEILIKDGERPDIFDISTMPMGAVIDLPEFSGVELRRELNHNAVSLLRKKYNVNSEEVIIGGNEDDIMLLNLFLADINKDGKPEVCATTLCYYHGDMSYYSYKYVAVYDIENGEKYVYSEPHHDVYLELRDGVLGMVSQGIITEDLSNIPLELERFTKE